MAEQHPKDSEASSGATKKPFDIDGPEGYWLRYYLGAFDQFAFPLIKPGLEKIYREMRDVRPQ